MRTHITLPDHRALLCVALLFVAVALSPRASAQIPETFTNLKVLPADIDRNGLMDVMRGFSQALDVRCTHCHVGEEGKPFSTFNFPSDEKPPKSAARTMLRMVNAINSDHLMQLGEDETPSVQCITCHRGVLHPETTSDALQHAYDAGGADSAAAVYRHLREQYYGAGNYDFRELVLNGFAGDLAGRGETVAAIALLKLNSEFYPDSDQIQAIFGMAYMRAGDSTAARRYFERALELNPDNRFAKRQLERLGE